MYLSSQLLLVVTTCTLYKYQEKDEIVDCYFCSGPRFDELDSNVPANER